MPRLLARRSPRRRARLTLAALMIEAEIVAAPAAVAAGASGARTDVVFDVTGYFAP
jgi:hypothetical protein